MSNEDKKIVLCIQNIIDIILEDKEFVIDSNRLKKIYDYFNKTKLFDDEFINRYIDFIEIFNNFFDFLIEKIEEYEKDVIKYGEELEHGYFTFNFEAPVQEGKNVVVKPADSTVQNSSLCGIRKTAPILKVKILNE